MLLSEYWKFVMRRIMPTCSISMSLRTSIATTYLSVVDDIFSKWELPDPMTSMNSFSLVVSFSNCESIESTIGAFLLEPRDVDVRHEGTDGCDWVGLGLYSSITGGDGRVGLLPPSHKGGSGMYSIWSIRSTSNLCCSRWHRAWRVVRTPTLVVRFTPHNSSMRS